LGFTTKRIGFKGFLFCTEVSFESREFPAPLSAIISRFTLHSIDTSSEERIPERGVMKQAIF